MEEIHVTYSYFIPIIDIFWNDNCREEFNFLKNNILTGKQILSDWKEYKANESQNLKTRETSTQKYPYILKYGHLYWNFPKGGYSFLRANRSFIYSHQPIRPLLKLQTKSITWKRLDWKEFNIINARKRITIHPSLCIEIEREVTFKVENSIEEIFDNIERIKEFSNNELKEEDEILNIKKTLFKQVGDTDIIDVANYPLIIVETSESISKAINSKFTNMKDFGCCKFKVEKKDIWVLQYKNKVSNDIKPVSKEMRNRIKLVIKTVYILKYLIERAQFLILMVLPGMSNKNSVETIEFVEYVISTLDPKIYSISHGPVMFQPLYLRIFFEEFAKLRDLYNLFSVTHIKLINAIRNWYYYTQMLLCSKNSGYMYKFREELDIGTKMEESSIKSLEEKDFLLLEYMIKIYHKSLTRDRKYIEEILTKKEYLYGMTKNSLKKIGAWQDKEKGLKSRLISESEIKNERGDKTPKCMQNLLQHELIIIGAPEKKNENYRVYLNIKNDFIRQQILNYR